LKEAGVGRVEGNSARLHFGNCVQRIMACPETRRRGLIYAEMLHFVQHDNWFVILRRSRRIFWAGKRGNETRKAVMDFTATGAAKKAILRLLKEEAHGQSLI